MRERAPLHNPIAPVGFIFLLLLSERRLDAVGALELAQVSIVLALGEPPELTL